MQKQSRYGFLRLQDEERWVALLPADSPLAQKESVTARDLLPYPLILPERASVQSELASWFGSAYEQLQVLFTSNLPSTSAVFVREGLACAIVIDGSTAGWDPEEIVSRPLAPALQAFSVLAWKAQQPTSIAVTKFLQVARTFLTSHS